MKKFINSGWTIAFASALFAIVAQSAYQSIIQSSANLQADISFSDFQLPPYYRDSYQNGGIVFASIRNTGNKPASSVELILPNLEVSKFKKDGKVIVSTGSTILVGNLRPKENVSVTAWTSISLSEVSLRDASLTHSDGIGTITIEQKYMGNPFFLHMKQNWPLWAIFLLVILFFLTSLDAAKRMGKN